MIPPDINVEDLHAQLQADGIALESSNDLLHQDLEFALSYAEEKGMHDVGVVIIDRVPAHYADMRDIAQELALRAELDTVILKAPGTGAIVSTDYSRAEIEAIQGAFFAEPNYGLGMRMLVDDFVAGAFDNGWPYAALFMVIVLGVIMASGWAQLKDGAIKTD